MGGGTVVGGRVGGGTVVGGRVGEDRAGGGRVGGDTGRDEAVLPPSWHDAT